MAGKLSDLAHRSPTTGMSLDDLLQQAYKKDFARMQAGQMVRDNYMQSLSRGADFARSGIQRPRAIQASRASTPMPQQEVGSAEDALGGFNVALDSADKLARMMRERYEAQKPGWQDYLKQAALGMLPKLVGMM